MSIIDYEAFDEFYKQLDELHEKTAVEIGKLEIKQKSGKPEKEAQSNIETCKKK